MGGYFCLLPTLPYVHGRGEGRISDPGFHLKPQSHRRIALCSQQLRGPHGLHGKPSPFHPRTSWTHCSRLLGPDHRSYTWAKQAISEKGVPLICPFPASATLPKGLLVKHSPPSKSQPKGVHTHLCFHRPRKALVFREQRKIIARTSFNIKYGHAMSPPGTPDSQTGF